MIRLNAISIYKSAVAAFAILLSAAVSGCQSEELQEVPFDPASSAVEFRAVVTNDVNLSTRTLVKEDIRADIYNMDFFIQLCTESTANAPEPEIGTYVIPSGYSGWLESKSKSERLNWKDLTSDHIFYGWNLPWTTKSYDDLVEEEKESGRIADGGAYPLHPLTIEFHDSYEGAEGYDKYHNDESLRYFIGTKAGPVNYKDNGTYVELVFRHLVSKIEINKLSMIDGPHTIVNNLKAEITFYGMPRSATFYPHPSAAVGRSGEWDGWPIVVANKPTIADLDEEECLTYFIPEDPKGEIDDIFYVCPELDFSNMIFRIDIKDERYADRSSYYGNFNNVKFVRIPGNDYDEGNDEKILHAGEVMHLVIELYPGMGPGLSVVIDDWSTDKSSGRDAVHHSHPGIYSDSEAQDLIDVFGKSSYTDAEVQNLKELYGDPDNENKFLIYEDITIKGDKFPVGKGYEIDGLGHTITMTPSNNVVTVGLIKDVYITDGKNTIWIDPDGVVWKQNADTKQFEKTTYKLTSSGNNKINLSTGKVN